MPGDVAQGGVAAGGIAAGGVATYIEQLPAARRGPLTELRNACVELLEGFEESMAYGMPSYSRAGEVEVAFASRKRYISLYILRTDVLDPHRAELAGLDVGKGCIRYRRPEQVDMGVVRSMLSATARSPGPVC
jgi:uncharacterized protein YdhG (YjbR/CyaY superfamily)